MHVIASQKFDIARQQPYYRDRRGDDRNTDCGHLGVSRLGLNTITDESETYYWTDEGNPDLQQHAHSGNHSLPLYAVPADHGTEDALLKALAARGIAMAIIVSAIVLGMIGLAGSVGLERAERAEQIARV
jgi:hypothetical protein